MENETNKVVANPENADVLKQSLIEHLSTEISTLTSLRSSWRTQVMSLIYIGPFLILSSIFFGNKSLPKEFQLSWLHWCLMIIALTCWILLGVIAGIVEEGIWKKCNDWRDLILNIASGNIDISKINSMDFRHNPGKIPLTTTYFVVYFLLGTIFFCIIYLVSTIFFV